MSEKQGKIEHDWNGAQWGALGLINSFILAAPGVQLQFKSNWMGGKAGGMLTILLGITQKSEPIAQITGHVAYT